MEYFSSLITAKNLSAKDSSVHPSLQPYIHFFSEKYANQPDTHRIFKFIFDDPALDIVFFRHVIKLQPRGEKFKLFIDPMLNLNTGREHYNGKMHQVRTNSRGIIGGGYIGDKVYFETMFSENQAFLPQYLGDATRATLTVPGQGRWKRYKATGFDYAFSSGFVSIQAVKNVNIQFGHGKHKIGNGYRSLLLSDNSFNYPYARVTQQWLKGRLQYTNIYAALMNMVPASTKPNPNAEPLLQKKAASFQYLSVNPFRFLNVGFFQGMIWRAGDKTNTHHFTWHYFNPAIYTNLIEKRLNDSNNILIGTDIKIRINDNINVYGQLMADDLSNSKATGNAFGYQAGACYYNALGVRNLFLQAEYNAASEGSYSSPITARSNQSYSHYNQNLAFTPGYGQELLFIADFKYKRFNVNGKYHYQIVPKSGDYYYTTEIVTGQAGYLINPAYNLNISIGFIYRNQNFPNFRGLSNQTNYMYIGLKTNLYNLYYDF